MNNLILNPASPELPRTSRGQSVSWNSVKTATIEIYRQHVVVKRSYVRAETQTRTRVVGDGGSDGMGDRVDSSTAALDLEPVARRKGATIQVFSRGSVKRLRFAADELTPIFKTMITLTMPGSWVVGSSDGRESKQQLHRFLMWAKAYFERVYNHKLRGLWFLEFQSRMAPHYHLYIDFKPTMQQFPGMIKAVSEAWYRAVGSGELDHLNAGTRCELLMKEHGLQAYAIKYAEKFQQKEVPDGYENVGRFWGLFGVKVRPERIIAGVVGDTARLAREVLGPVLFAGIDEVTSLVRVARRAAVQTFHKIQGWKRRKNPALKFRKPSADGGLWPKTFYGAAAAVRAYLASVGSLDLAEVS